VYTVEAFTTQAVKINRVDQNGGIAVLTGELSPQSNSIVNGTITWTAVGSGTFPFTMAWGTAFSSARVAANQSQSTQVTGRDVYEGAKAVREAVSEIKKWNDFFQLFSSAK
jgi:hypothetical protein